MRAPSSERALADGRALHRIVTQYLDHAEDQAERRHPMRMADWRERPDAFLQFNEREVPEDTGRVSHEVAKRLAETEFDAYEAERRRLGATEPTSDFDRFIEETKQLSKGRPTQRKPTEGCTRTDWHWCRRRDSNPHVPKDLGF